MEVNTDDYMESNPLKFPISSITGILAIIIFCIFTFTAVALFPTYYSPVNNWLSDLGNSNFNPSGSIFFNLGCILTGIVLIPFFIGLYRWYTAKKWQKNLLIVAQIIGIFSAFTLIMIGIFSEDYGALHGLWSALFFVSLLLTMITLNISLLGHEKFKKWIGYYGFFAVLVDLTLIISTLFPNGLPIPLIEWLTTFISLSWVGLLVYNMFEF